MNDNYLESSKTFIVYIVLVIYLVLSPVSGMLNVLGVMQPIPWIYFILMFLVLYLFLKLLQLHHTPVTREVSIPYIIGLGLLIYVIYAELISGTMLMHDLPRLADTTQTLLASTIILFIFFFIAGSKLVDLNNLLQKKPFKVLTLLFYLFYCAAICWTAYTLNSAVTVNTNTLITLNANFNYLFISDTFAIFTFIVMWLVFQSTTLRWLIAINSMALLYVTRSRTVFFLFIFCLFITVILQTKNKKNWLILGIIALLFFALGGNDLIFNNQNSIIFSLIFDTSHDESFISRQELFTNGMKVLKDYWVLGLPLAEVWIESPGEYFHNFLSFWVCFGILPFTCFVALSIYCVSKLITLLRIDPLNKLTMFLVIYFLFVYIEIITSRAYVYPYVWACLSTVPVVSNHFSGKKAKTIIEKLNRHAEEGSQVQ